MFTFLSLQSTARQQTRTCSGEVSEEDENRRIECSKGGMRKTEVRGGSGTPKCLQQGPVCRVCWITAGQGLACVWPWMQAIFYPDSHRVIHPRLLSCSPNIFWAEPPPRLIIARTSQCKGLFFLLLYRNLLFSFFCPHLTVLELQWLTQPWPCWRECNSG